MPDFSMFGPEQNGAAIALSQIQSLQSNDLHMQQQREAIMASQQQHQQQQHEEQQKSAASLAQQKQQEQMSTIAKANGAGSALDLSQSLFAAGYVDAGTKLMAASSKSLMEVAQTKEHEANAAAKNLDVKEKQLEGMARAIEGTNSQADLDRIMAAAKASGTKIPPELEGVKWSPELRTSLDNHLISLKDKLEQARLAGRAAVEKQRDAILNKLTQAQIAKDAAETSEIKTRTDILKKNGGSGKTETTPKQYVDQALNLISRDYPSDGIEDNPGANAQAAMIADEAQGLLRMNPGLKWPQAIQQAFTAAKQRGDITPPVAGVKFPFNPFKQDVPAVPIQFDPGHKTSTGTTTFGSSSEAESAAKAGKLKKGDRIIVDGQPGTWQ